MNGLIYMLGEALTWPIVLALLAGAGGYLCWRRWAWLAKALALAASAAVLVMGVWLGGRTGYSLHWRWLELTPGVALDLDLAAGPLGALLVGGAGGFGLLIGLYSLVALKGQYWQGKFYAYLAWAVAGTCLVGLAGNLLMLLVGWELVTLMLFLLVNQGRDGTRAAAKTYGVLGFADACLLLAVALLAACPGGTGNLRLGEAPVAPGQWGPVGYLIYALILVAALAKAGAVPLHTWIPSAAQDGPAPVTALLPAALDKLMGIYLLAVLSLRLFQPDWPLRAVMMSIGALTVLAAVLMAMMQHNLKRLLGFHAVSQVGYMVLGLGTGSAVGIIGGLFHMLNHAIYKSNLFLMSGTVARAGGTDEVADMGGLAKALPVTFVCGLISAAAISGVPPLNGFASKWLVYQGALEVARTSPGIGSTVLVVAVFGSALTLASFVKVMYSAFLSPAPRGRAEQPPAVRENFWLACPMVVLAAACVLLGLLPTLPIRHLLAPALSFLGAEEPSALAASAEAVSIRGLGFWSPTQATGLILLGLLLGLAYVWVATRGRKVRVVRPFLAGEVPAAGDDRFRVPGTELYETIRRLPVLGPLLDHGQAGAMDAYHWSGKYGQNLVELLRAQHTGLLGLYVAWCLMGITATLAYLLLTM